MQVILLKMRSSPSSYVSKQSEKGFLKTPAQTAFSSPKFENEHCQSVFLFKLPTVFQILDILLESTSLQGQISKLLPSTMFGHGPSS